MARRKLVALWGQSNAVGGANTADATLVPAADLNRPYPNVTYSAHINQGEWETIGPHALQPRNTVRIGPEITLGWDLDAQVGAGEVVIVKVGDNGSGLDSQWKPSVSDLYPIARDFVQAQEEALHARMMAMVWVQGNGDSNTQIRAERYAENLLELLTQLRLDFPGLRVFTFERFPFVNASNPWASTVRAEQAVFAASRPDDVVMVDADDCPQRDDDHYAADGKIILGRRFAAAVAPFIRDQVTVQEIREREGQYLREHAPSSKLRSGFRRHLR